MHKAILETWAVIGSSSGRPCLTGTVYGHPKVADGSNVITAPLDSLDYANRRATALGVEYQLGTPDPNFLKYLQTHDPASIAKYNLAALPLTN